MIATGQVRRGVAWAGLAALLFGMTAPLLQRASAGVGPLVSGSLLYLGAALGAGLMVAVGRGAGPATSRSTALRLLAVALVGGALAPTLLVLGLARTDAATASLLLALEAPFTVLLARAFLHEFIGRRVAAAAALTLAGGAVLAAASSGARVAGSGPIFVAAAALAWALDNLLSRPLADRDPRKIVALKGLLGGLASAAAALLWRQALPRPWQVLALLGLGAVGYGLSLQLYLRAQRLVGAARTASVFATAPFVGVAVAFAVGAPWPGLQLPVGAAFVALGVWLHLTEQHSHHHHHPTIEHEHLHTHDDGHHDHRHDPMPAGPHSHPHHHDTVTHHHEHSEDLHHVHRH